MRRILFGQIHHSPFFFEPDKGKTAGEGALEAGHFNSENTSSDDEAPPDFGQLEAKYGDGEATPKPGTPEIKEPVTETKPATTPATQEAAKPQEEAQKATDGRPRNADGTFKANTEEPFPEIPPVKPKEEVKPAPAAPAVEQKKPETTPVKPVEPVKVEEKKPEEKKLPTDDADIEAMQPKPTASQKTQDDFRALKTKGKEARAYARELETKLAELSTKPAAELPEDVKTKLAQADEDRKFREMFELENDPKARAEYSSKLTAAEEAIIKKLTDDPRLKLPKEEAEWLKANFDTEEGIKKRNGWFKSIREKIGDELLVQEVAELFRGRQKLISDRSQEIEKLRGNQGEYLKQRQEQEKGEFTNWGKQADQTLLSLAAGHDWADFMKEPENATQEQKDVIAAHNKRVQEELVPAFNKAVLDVWGRNPAETIKHIFESFRVKQELEPEIASLKASVAEKDKRIAELEELASGVRRISEVSQAEQSPPAGTQPTVQLGSPGEKEASSEDALDAYLKQKGIR